jgi:hypothetical protein
MRDVAATLTDPERRRALARVAEQGHDPADRGSALLLLARFSSDCPDVARLALDRVHHERDAGVLWMIAALMTTRDCSREAMRAALIRRIGRDGHQPSRQAALQVLCSYFGTDPDTRLELMRLAIDDADRWARRIAIHTLASAPEEPPRP